MDEGLWLGAAAPILALSPEIFRVKGKPLRSERMPVVCHPPSTLLSSQPEPPQKRFPDPTGRAYTLLNTKFCGRSKSETPREPGRSYAFCGDSPGCWLPFEVDVS